MTLLVKLYVYLLIYLTCSSFKDDKTKEKKDIDQYVHCDRNFQLYL